MFHRLTLFNTADKVNFAAIDKLFNRLEVQASVQKLSNDVSVMVHQWQWYSHDKLVFLQLDTLLKEQSKQSQFDYVLQSADKPIQKIKLAVFDMDSTLIQAEVMDELAYAKGIGPQVANITVRSMAGELDFEQSFRKRLALLEGFETNQLAAINNSIKLMPGSENLMKGLLSQGIYCVILSGGFSYFADALANQLGMQDAFSNGLEEVDGKLTGKVSGVIVDANRKVELMEQLRTTLGLTLEQCLAVGDGANDLPMLNKAGLGVAFHGKLLVRQQAPHQINNLDLDALLHLV